MPVSIGKALSHKVRLLSYTHLYTLFQNIPGPTCRHPLTVSDSQQLPAGSISMSRYPPHLDLGNCRSTSAKHLEGGRHRDKTIYMCHCTRPSLFLWRRLRKSPVPFKSRRPSSSASINQWALLISLKVGTHPTYPQILSHGCEGEAEVVSYLRTMTSMRFPAHEIACRDILHATHALARLPHQLIGLLGTKFLF